MNITKGRMITKKYGRMLRKNFTCLCFYTILSECELPLLNDHLEIINETFNGIVVSSELHFRCQSGFVNNNLRPAVCSSEGLWVPNPQEYECQQTIIIKEGIETKMNINIDFIHA